MAPAVMDKRVELTRHARLENPDYSPQISWLLKDLPTFLQRAFNGNGSAYSTAAFAYPTADVPTEVVVVTACCAKEPGLENGGEEIIFNVGVAIFTAGVSIPEQFGGKGALKAAEAGLADLAKFRSELGLAAPSPGAATLARLDVGGESFYGISAHGQEITFPVNAVSETHAEADAFQQAINAGVSSPNATLYIDNISGVCGYCSNSGIASMMGASGVSSLTVVSPRGIMIFGQ